MKVAIITITGGDNYGNRLQNYAVQTILQEKGIYANTIRNYQNIKKVKIFKIKKIIKEIIKKISGYKKYDNTLNRQRSFELFNKKYINFKYSISNYSIPKTICKEYDKIICGSDQIWNPNYKENSVVNFLYFSEKDNNIAFAPSFGSNTVPEERKEEYKNYINNIKYLSVRENAGKDIIENLTGRTDVEVLVDPTMLLTTEEWDKVARKPEELKSKKYILNYFLGEYYEKRRKEIEKIAEENECEIINILDKNSPFYKTGPSEFLYLEKNAFLVCTDSFHSCVFAILYNRPFVIFDREQKDIVSMKSRIDTLLSKFELKNRKFTGQITKENLLHDYRKAYEILEKEKEKANNFLKRALEI